MDNQDITESQLEQLDVLLQSFNNLDNCNNTKINGDDDDMIANVMNASEFSNGNNSSFLENMVYIESSYTK